MFPLLVAATGLFAGATLPPRPLPLAGVVQDSAGRAVPKATIFVRSAGPREGVGVLCPSCYPDCSKQAVTDGQGKFALRELDPGLVFRLLVVADGFVPAESPRPADPLAGSVSFTLTAHDLDRRDPARVFRGRVLDEGGKPALRGLRHLIIRLGDRDRQRSILSR